MIAHEMLAQRLGFFQIGSMDFTRIRPRRGKTGATTSRCDLGESATQAMPGPALSAARIVAQILTLQRRHVLEQVERFGIGQRLDILHRTAMHHVTHGQLGYLAGLGARNVSHRHDLFRHMPR